MQEYKGKKDYGGIFMTWCAGYLSNGELVEFLREAKTWLAVPPGRNMRTAPSGYIFVFDSVLDPVDEEEHEQQDQRVRW